MKILISRNIAGEAEANFLATGHEVVTLANERTQDEFYEAMKPADAVITMLSDKIGSSELDKFGTNLKIIANYAVGYNNIDIEACNKREIIVTNTPDVLTDATADTTMALLLMCMKRIPENEKLLRNNKFIGWRPNILLGRDLKGKNLGILGMGRIGEAVARRAEAFGMNILYHTKSGVKTYLPYPAVSFATLLKESDVLSIHCPLTPQTKHMIGASEIELMKDDAVIINTARGAVIDEEAFAKALSNNKLYYGGCDVFENEPKVNKNLLVCQNAVLLPHIGSATIETRTEMTNLTIKSVLEALSGNVPELAINS